MARSRPIPAPVTAATPRAQMRTGGSRDWHGNWFGAAALLRAVEYGEVSTVKVLLLHGAEPNEADRDGWCALELATDYEEAVVVILLLLMAGADPDGEHWDEDGNTPLANARKHRSAKIHDMMAAAAKTPTADKE